MTEYACKRCGYSTKIRKIYQNHIIKKIICKPILSSIERSHLVHELDSYIQSASKGGINVRMEHNGTQMEHNGTHLQHNGTQMEHDGTQDVHSKKLENVYQCLQCNKLFCRNSSLRRHERLFCKKNNFLKEELENLKEEIKELKNHNNKITNVSNINGNVNTNNIQNNNTIHIHSYGKEDFSYIDDQTLLLAHRAPFISIPLLVTKMFFNDEHPENQNVKWKNKKINYMQRLENGENGPEWVNRDKNEVIRDLNDRA
jgi:hypothetical protein